jgi:hypothetical protein
MTYSIHMMEDLLRKRFKNRASVRSVDVRSTDLMEILDIIYKIRYMRRAAMKQARQTAKGVVVSLTEFVQSGSHPGDAVFDAIADMHRDITGKEWKNGAERPRVDGNLRSEVAVQYDAAYVKKLEAQIAHLREERTAFIDAANALAGTTGFAWTAALAVASGRAEKVEVRLKAAIDELLRGVVQASANERAARS